MVRGWRCNMRLGEVTPIDGPWSANDDKHHRLHGIPLFMRRSRPCHPVQRWTETWAPSNADVLCWNSFAHGWIARQDNTGLFPPADDRPNYDTKTNINFVHDTARSTKAAGTARARFPFRACCAKHLSLPRSWNRRTHLTMIAKNRLLSMRSRDCIDRHQLRSSEAMAALSVLRVPRYLRRGHSPLHQCTSRASQFCVIPRRRHHSQGGSATAG